MANINDYLLWRGDIPLSRRFPFNEIDSMILSRFSYLRLDKITLTPLETVASVSEKMRDFPEDTFLYHGDKELITNLGKSTRFQQMLVTDYEKIADKKTEKQFGAVTVHISDKEMYVSFLGTDSTIVGWKEDFNMAFMNDVPCQVSGETYLEKIARKYPHKKIRIGGHSKGGNVAVYASMRAPQEIQDRIIKVDNLDGPGFSKEMIEKYEKKGILDKIESFIPQESIIGRILYHKEKITIVLSLEKGIYQHDVYSWQVLGNSAVRSNKNTEASEDVSKTMTEWLESTTSEQRKIFFDSLFELFYSTDTDTFAEMRKSFPTSIPKMFEKYNTLSNEDKKVMTDIMKKLVSLYMNVIKERNTNKIKEKRWLKE